MWLTQSQCWCFSQLYMIRSADSERETLHLTNTTSHLMMSSCPCIIFFFRFTQLRIAKRWKDPKSVDKGFISSQPSLISSLSDISILSQPLVPHPDPQGVPFGIRQGSVRLWCISKVMSTVTDDWTSWCSVMCEVPRGVEVMGGLRERWRGDKVLNRTAWC